MHFKVFDSKWKLNKIWKDKGSESYNKSIKSWLQGNNIERQSILNT